VLVAYTGVTAEGSRGLGVLFDAKPAHITAIGRGRALVSIPELSAEGAIEVVLLTAEPRQSSGANFMIGRSWWRGSSGRESYFRSSRRVAVCNAIRHSWRKRARLDFSHHQRRHSRRFFQRRDESD
jgi:hypothetical protein